MAPAVSYNDYREKNDSGEKLNVYSQQRAFGARTGRGASIKQKEAEVA